MHKTSLLFPQDLYAKHLRTIKGIHFTRSEIDVISCILNMRETKIIAAFLSIAPSTFYRHISNIMPKIGCNSQQAIIDFMETPDVWPLLKEHYALLKGEVMFKKTLKQEILTLIQENNPICCFIHAEEEDSFFVSRLKAHLKLVGIAVSTGVHPKEGDCVLLVLSKTQKGKDLSSLLQKIKQNADTLFVLLRREITNQDILQHMRSFEIIDFTKEDAYYFSALKLLTKLFPDFNLTIEKIKVNFQEEYKKTSIAPHLIQNSSHAEVLEKISGTSSLLSVSGTLPYQTPPLPQKRLPSSGLKLRFFGFLQSSKDSRNKHYLLLAFIVMGLTGGGGVLTLKWSQLHPQGGPLRSDLILPKDSAFLARPELIKTIDEKFKRAGGIQTLALVGPGGAGKTTLARYYAQSQKTSFLWELNAETQRSLEESFEKIAHALATTEEDQRVLRGLLATKDFLDKEQRLLHFVKERLKSRSHWFLVYDNVEAFSDIHKYFPYDPEAWGEGKIILTTRDGSIENNQHVHHAVFVRDLTPSQKFVLFTKIMNHENETLQASPQIEERKKETRAFLEKIPPYPLDVLVAADYLKATQASYSTYLENLERYNKEFASLQESLLKEAGTYLKTRYGIITASLEHILNTHPDFRELLLLISVIDSQNIPRNLLTSFKDEAVVDYFIFNLKKHSLLTKNYSKSTLSLHRSTQAISLAYLIKKLGAEKSKELTTHISEVLENYIDNVIKTEKIPEMKVLVGLCDKFLSHKGLLTDKIEGMIKSKLGIIYFFTSDNLKAKDFLEESLVKLKNFYEENPTRVALALGYLGNAYRNLGAYNKSKDFLKASLSIYEEFCTQDPLRHAYFFVYLSILETYLGNYETAKFLLEKGLVIHRNFFPNNKNYAAWVSGYLGILERLLGNYEKAEALLERSLLNFQNEGYMSDIDIAWAFQHLSIVYIRLEKYEKAKHALTHSLKFLVSLFPDKVGSLWVSSHLSSPKPMGDNGDAKELFDNLLKIYKTHFHESYIDVAWHLQQLGILYKKLGNYEKAKILLEQQKVIVARNFGENHLETAMILNDLGEIYLLQGHFETAKNLLSKVYMVLKKSKHPNQYQCLENLSNLYMRIEEIAADKGHKEASIAFSKKAISYLREALETVRKHFPKNSAHEKRIQEKLAVIEKKK